jgi:hypothetical protein
MPSGSAQAMRSTRDGTYWWQQVAATDVAALSAGDFHGARYRYVLNRDADETCQDPAAGWVDGSGPDGWSRLVRQSAFAWSDASGRTPSWDWLRLYQLHPARFSGRGGSALTPFDRVAREIGQGYLQGLHVTGLQLMPVNEVGTTRSWGYDPAFFYAVEESYGGPDGLKRLVDTCHRHGLAVLLDVVFNHAGTTDKSIWPTARENVACELGTECADDIVFASNTHDFIIRLAAACPRSGQKLRCLTSDGEFHSARRQFARWAEDGWFIEDRVAAEPFEDFADRFLERAGSGDHDHIFVSQVMFGSGRIFTLVDELAAIARPDGPWVVIDGYHAFFAYHVGEPEAKVRPYILFGLGATHYGGFSFTAPGGTTQTSSGETQFSGTFGAGIKAYASPAVGFQAGMQWTPTYIKSDPAGYWCGYYGCYVVGNAQYSNQFEFVGGVTFRF